MYPSSIIIEAIDSSGIQLVRIRELSLQGQYKIRGLSKLTLKNLALALRNISIKFETKKNKVYGDIFSFNYGNHTYTINCKTKMFTMYKIKGTYNAF